MAERSEKTRSAVDNMRRILLRDGWGERPANWSPYYRADTHSLWLDDGAFHADMRADGNSIKIRGKIYIRPPKITTKLINGFRYTLVHDLGSLFLMGDHGAGVTKRIGLAYRKCL